MSQLCATSQLGDVAFGEIKVPSTLTHEMSIYTVLRASLFFLWGTFFFCFQEPFVRPHSSPYGVKKCYRLCASKPLQDISFCWTHNSAKNSRPHVEHLDLSMEVYVILRPLGELTIHAVIARVP